MSSEGQSKFSDLRHIRAKKVQLHYSKSSYKIDLGKRKFKTAKIITVALLVILLVFYLSQTRLFRQVQILWQIRNQKILVGFQNSAELRPSGGFWGSFGILEIDRKFNPNLRFDTNPYKKDNLLLKKSDVPLPKPLKETWPDRNQSFVNANYMVDFPETAKSLEWFLSEGWNEKTDGVIAISSLALIDLLKLTGEIEVNQVKINDQNFTRVLSDKIERDYWLDEENIRTNEPKTIIKDMIPEISIKARRLGIIKLYSFINDQITKGRLIAYSNNPKTQSIIERLDMGGEVKDSTFDHILVSNANLAGDKSSLNAKQRIVYKVYTEKNKTVAQLKITRTLNDGWPGHTNRNYTRVFAPLGSKLISSSVDKSMLEDVETSQESGLTYFGFWFSTDPGQTKTAELQYELPFANLTTKNYNLIWQKQPGTLPDEVEIETFGQKLYKGKLDQNYLKLTP